MIDSSAMPPRHAGEGRYLRLLFVAARKAVDTGLRRHDDVCGAGESIIRVPGIIPGAEKNDPPEGRRSPSSRSVVPGRGGFSAVPATGVSSPRSIIQAIKRASKQARKCFYHRGTRENDRVHRESRILALRARIWSNFARSAT